MATPRVINLAEELLLLAYDDAGHADAGTPALDCGLAGGLLLELTLARRLDVVGNRVAVIDDSPTGDPIADAALGTIAGDETKRTPQDWVGRLSRDVREEILDRLVADNVLRRERDKVLWIFPRTRYPSSTGELPSAEAEARRRLDAAIGGTVDGGTKSSTKSGTMSATVSPQVERDTVERHTVERRTVALGSLVRALHLERTAVPNRPVKEVRARIKAIAEAQRDIDSTDSTGRAVRTMERAVVGAIAAVTVITTTAAAT